jgi:hypothetical protein
MITATNPQPRKTALGLSFNEDGLCSSETKHDRMAPRPKLFVSIRILQEQWPQPQKFVLGSKSW